MENNGKFKKKCSECGVNDVWVYSMDRAGNLPKAYCGKVCETNAQYKKRFDKRYE
jgi:hypothetical protein